MFIKESDHPDKLSKFKKKCSKIMNRYYNVQIVSLLPSACMNIYILSLFAALNSCLQKVTGVR